MDPESRIEIAGTKEQAATELQPGAAPPEAAGDWSIPRPDILPRPTYAPAGLAFGAVFLLWGILTSYIVSIVGLVIFIISLAAWIGEILHERGT